ncbi:MAG: hypothetical protein GEU28_10210 [Dehalococcoidia bacterium]|nr:hypothetical protein [Dehalococcoidia bacterium]
MLLLGMMACLSCDGDNGRVAAEALLSLDDLPTGWVEESAGDVGDVFDYLCVPTTVDTVVAARGRSSFRTDGGADGYIVHHVVVFDGGADRVMEVAGLAFIGCASVSLFGVRPEAVELPGLGDESAGFVASADDGAAGGISVHAVYIRRGDALALVMANGVDEGTVVALSRLADERLETLPNSP